MYKVLFFKFFGTIFEKALTNVLCYIEHLLYKRNISKALSSIPSKQKLNFYFIILCYFLYNNYYNNLWLNYF